VNVNGGVAIEACSLNSNGRSWTLGASGNVTFTGSASTGSSSVMTSATFGGTGVFAINAGAGIDVKAGATLTLSTSTLTVGGNLTCSGDGSIAVTADKNLMITAGGRIQRNTGGTGSITIAASSNLTFATGASWLTGASISLSGNAYVQTGGSLSVSAASSCTGGGNVTLDGALNVNANLAATVGNVWVRSGGAVHIVSGAALTVTGAVTFQTGAAASVTFGAGAWAESVITGTLTCTGSLTVNVNVRPANKTVLFRATAVTGTFASVSINVGASGRRLLGSGEVTYTPTTVEFTPGASSAAQAQWVFAPLAAFLVLLF